MNIKSTVIRVAELRDLNDLLRLYKELRPKDPQFEEQDAHTL